MGRYIYALRGPRDSFHAEVCLGGELDTPEALIGTLKFAFKPWGGWDHEKENESCENHWLRRVKRAWKNKPDYPAWVTIDEKPRWGALVYKWGPDRQLFSDSADDSKNRLAFVEGSWRVVSLGMYKNLVEAACQKGGHDLKAIQYSLAGTPRDGARCQRCEKTFILEPTETYQGVS